MSFTLDSVQEALPLYTQTLEQDAYIGEVRDLLLQNDLLLKSLRSEKNEVNRLEAKLLDLQDELVNEKTYRVRVEADNLTLKRQIKELGVQDLQQNIIIKMLKSKVEAMEQKINDQSEEKIHLRDEINAMRDSSAAKSHKIQNLELQIKFLENRPNTLSTKVDTVQQTLDSLLSKVRKSTAFDQSCKTNNSGAANDENVIKKLGRQRQVSKRTCDSCGMSFSTLNFARHRKSCVPLVCEDCDRNFKTKSNLERHIATNAKCKKIREEKCLHRLSQS